MRQEKISEVTLGGEHESLKVKMLLLALTSLGKGRNMASLSAPYYPVDILDQKWVWLKAFLFGEKPKHTNGRRP